MKAYLQTCDGHEEELTVVTPDPADATYVILIGAENIVWIRIVPDGEDYMRPLKSK